MLVFFAVSGLVVQGVLLKFSERKGALFVRVFIVTTALKFMLYLAVLIGLLLYSSENRQSLVLHFLVYYLVFTALETRTMYGVIRKMKA
ncbi:MAG TPA: hypothetical protein VG603_11185 [Chitinophagales bacterium]|nr:hypothetical protein [Chitinophagales bacterium]